MGPSRRIDAYLWGVALVVASTIVLRFALPFVDASMLPMIYLLGVGKSYVRLKAVAIPLANYRKHLWWSLPAHLLLWPFASALFLCNAVTAGFSRRIKWRGITYELKSATEAVIITRE